MKILIITPLPLNVGMAQWTLVDFARDFTAAGHSVVLADGSRPGPNQLRASNSAIAAGLGGATREQFDYFEIGSVPIPTLKELPKLAKLFAWADVVVYTQYYFTDLLFGILGALASKPTGSSLGNTLQRPKIRTLREFGHRAYMGSIGRLVLRHAAFVRLCNKSDVALVARWGQPSPVLVYPPARPGTSRSNLAHDPGSPFKILVTGRPTVQKGLDVAATAIESVLRSPEGSSEKIELHLSLTTDSARFFSWFRPTENCSMVLHPDLDRDRFLELLSKVDLLVVPSRYESFGKVAMEAASFGVVVIGTDVPGLREIIVPNSTGFLVRPDDPEDLARAIAYCLHAKRANPDVWMQLREHALRHFESTFSSKETKRQEDDWLQKMGRAMA